MNTDAAYDPIAVTGLVASGLESVGIPYVITGSVASTVYGTARATMDVDICNTTGSPRSTWMTDKGIGRASFPISIV